MQRITITLACFLIWVNCCSQQYPFVHYTPKDGLANSRVKKAYQDSKGRMYFLTYGGLSVYDGARFVNYSMQDGLANNVVNDILEVGDDSLLVATNSSVVNVLVKGKIGKLETKGAGNVLVNQFYRSSGGKIFLSSDYGLYQMENNVVKELDISLMATANRGPFLSDLSCTGNYLVISINEMGDHKGLYLYDIINNSLCDGLKDLFIYLLGKDNHNYTWVFLHNKLFVLDNIALAQGKLSLKEPPVPYVESKNYSTTNIAFDKNSIWFLYRNKDYRNTEIRRICDDGARLRMPLPAQATAADIKNIFLDKENTIWLSSDGEGVFKIVRSPMRIFQNPLGEANQSQVDYAYYSPSATWFGTNTKKLFRRSNNTLQQFNSNIEKPPVVFYDDGKKLLAHDRLNIYEAQLDGHSSIRFRKTITLPDSEFLDKKIMVDCNNNIIAGQKYSLSVWNHNKRVYQFPFDKNDVAEEIFLSKDKLLWIVTRFNGIYVFSVHPEDLPHYLQTVHRFPKQQIVGSPRSFVIDKTGMIWIGTRENGVSAYRETGDQLVLLHHLDASTGLTDNFVTSLACDSSNNIIVGTQTGLDRILRDKKDSCRIENLSKTSNFFALIKQSWAESGQAYAVTYAGALISISPAVSDGPSFTPQLFVEEMKVNASSTAIGQRQFPYNKNNISFSVAAPSFIDEDRVLYSYIVNGSGNTRWSDTSAANSVINLTNLSPGKYILYVKAFFPSNLYSPAKLSHAFEIFPPWWQTWWSKSLVGLIMISLLVFSVRYYYRRKLEKQRVTLEKQQAIEKERTRIATDMHDDLGAGLSRIKFLSQSIVKKKVKDDVLATELEKITSFSDEMAEKMGEIVWALNEKNDTLADLVAYTRSYAVEYLANHDIPCEADTPLHLPGTFITGEVRRNIFLSVKECLHNIVKHSGATNVRFSVQLDGQMQIVIHDNGKGIDLDNRRAFSNGLENIKKRMKEINGEVKFFNEHGTKVLLNIPLIL